MTPRPFTVVSGFLGAGKTTLVNRIVASGGRRYAVLVNDFGAVNVDAGLIAAHDGQTIALTNGCICCSMADGFITAMLRLMADPGAFDHVVVEASGVAEPDRIMDFARADPMLAPDAILTLADAETLAARLADPRVGEIVVRQIRAADLIVLTKCDLTDPAPAETALAALTRAPVLHAGPETPPLAALLGIGGAGERRDPSPSLATSFHTRSFEAESLLDRAAFETWAATLPADVLRGKGRLALTDGTGAIWQKVGTRATLIGAAPPARTQVVLIGTGPLDTLPKGPFA